MECWDAAAHTLFLWHWLLGLYIGIGGGVVCGAAGCYGVLRWLGRV